MRLFSIGCKDSGNVPKPMMTVLRELKKLSRGNQLYAVHIEMVMVRWDILNDSPLRQHFRKPKNESHIVADVVCKVCGCA
jgi:hypothetical protein